MRSDTGSSQHTMNGFVYAIAYRFEYDCYVTWSWVSLATWCCLMSRAAVGTEIELHAAERTSWRSVTAREEFKTLKPEEFSPNRRSAAVESLEPLQPLNSNAMYAVVTATPELVYTRTDDDILDPEIRRVDGSIQLVRWLQAAYSRSRRSVSNCRALLTDSRSLIVCVKCHVQSTLHRWQRGPLIMLQLTDRRGPDWQSLRAVFGPRAGLCRPLV